MRDITVRLLIFSSMFGLPACAPSVPSLGGPATPAGSPDAAPDRALPQGPALGDAPAPRPDAGSVPNRPETGKDAAADTGRDAPGDAPRETMQAARDGAPDRPGDGAAADTGRDATKDAGPPDTLPARAPRPGELVIDEVLVDPAGNDLGHEWLELANLTDDALDLSSLHVSDGTTDVAAGAGILEARGLVVLGQSADRAHNGDAPVAWAYGTKLAFNNGADRVAICLGSCAAGVTLAAWEWTDAFGAAYAGHAVVVAPETGTTCPAAEPYGAGGNFGTPGRANPPCAAPPDGGP